MEAFTLEFKIMLFYKIDSWQQKHLYIISPFKFSKFSYSFAVVGRLCKSYFSEKKSQKLFCVLKINLAPVFRNMICDLEHAVQGGVCVLV